MAEGRRRARGVTPSRASLRAICQRAMGGLWSQMWELKPIAGFCREKRLIDEGGSQRMLKEIARDDGVEDLIERLDRGVIEMIELERERTAEDQHQKGQRRAGIHLRSFQSWWKVRAAGAGHVANLSPARGYSWQAGDPAGFFGSAAKIERLQFADQCIEHWASHAGGPGAVDEALAGAVQCCRRCPAGG